MISYLDLIGLVCFVINYIGQALSLLNAGRSSKIYLIYLKIELPDDRAITIVVVFHHPSVWYLHFQMKDGEEEEEEEEEEETIPLHCLLDL